MNKEVQDLIQQGKDSIVQSALKLVGGGVTMDHFTKIVVQASKKEIYVSLLNPIKYLPKNSAFYTDIEAILIEKGTTCREYSNPKVNNSDIMDLPFYKETEEGRKHIHFVFESIKSGAPFDISKFDGSMIIRDETNFFDINVESEYYHSWYKLDKLTGGLFDKGHAHFLEPPSSNADNREILIEIK